MGVDLEKKRKLLLYPIEYQRGCPCEWVLEFARVGDLPVEDGNGGGAFGLRDGRARTAREAPNHFLSVSSASTTARGATTRTEVMRAGSNMGPGGQGEGGAQWAWT